jgi:serine/threonine protein kinase
LALKNELQVSWIGCQVGDVFIEELLGDGQFAWTYQGFNQKRLEKNIVKVAKPAEVLQKPGVCDLKVTQAFKLFTGGFSPVVPDAAELLELQSKRMHQDSSQTLARLEQFVSTDSLSYLRAEFIEGVTLRELRGHYGPVSTDMALDLVRTVGSLQQGGVKYHGDLTPDNIMISYSSVRLLDPGYFGPLGCIDGVFEQCAVTTPAYYPYLVSDDLLALGIIFWELHFGSNPFDSTANGGDSPAARPSTRLQELHHRYENAGRILSDGLLSFPHPRALEPEINPQLEKFLLRSLGLSLNGADEVDVGERFASSGQMAESLMQLSSQGLSEL